MTFVIGVDGGGTGSRAMILDEEGRELGTATGPPAVMDLSNPGRAAEAVQATVQEAASRAGVSLPGAALWAGVAGSGRPGAREAVEIALRSFRLARLVTVGMDVEGAHRDAFPSGPGVLLLLGSGSAVWGRDPEGREVRVGGWGVLLGDEGSGYWLGLQGLRAVAAATDGRGPATLLKPMLLERLHLPDAPALIPWMAGAQKGEVAALAPKVFEAASRGDPAATSVVERALAEIRRHLEVVGRIWEAWGGPFPVGLVGGIAEDPAALRPYLEALVPQMGGELRPGKVHPTRGAALLALELLHRS